MLYRISIGDHRHEFLLKGALLFDVWFDTPSRPTRDIDLLGSGSADAERIADVFRAACVSNVPDGITFDPITVATTEIRKVADYPGIRATMRVNSTVHRSTSKSTLDLGMLSRPGRYR
jgi:hypothetical protein